MLTNLSGIIILALSLYLMYRQIFKIISQSEEILITHITEKRIESVIVPLIYSEQSYYDYQEQKENIYLIKVKDVSEMISVDFDEYRNLNIGDPLRILITRKTYMLKWFWGEPKIYERVFYEIRN